MNNLIEQAKLVREISFAFLGDGNDPPKILYISGNFLHFYTLTSQREVLVEYGEPGNSGNIITCTRGSKIDISPAFSYVKITPIIISTGGIQPSSGIIKYGFGQYNETSTKVTVDQNSVSIPATIMNTADNAVLVNQVPPDTLTGIAPLSIAPGSTATIPAAASIVKRRSTAIKSASTNGALDVFYVCGAADTNGNGVALSAGEPIVLDTVAAIKLYAPATNGAAVVIGVAQELRTI